MRFLISISFNSILTFYFHIMFLTSNFPDLNLMWVGFLGARFNVAGGGDKITPLPHPI